MRDRVSLRARPTIGRRGRSTYTVLGFVGYLAATVLGTWLSRAWELSLAERVIALVAPPFAFILTIAIATAIKGRVWIVFYQAAFAALALVSALGIALGGDVARLADVTVVGIGTFLVFGRVGCFHVACCYGRPAHRGVVYGPEHVALGLWRRRAGRPLFPVQLVESAGSALLVVLALALSLVGPGTAALVYGVGYGTLRFVLELVRGDPARPHALGLSEAQWFSLLAIFICVACRPGIWTLASCTAVIGLAAWLASHRRARQLLLPSHLQEIDELAEAVARDPAHRRSDSTFGVGVSCHPLGGGKTDVILSSPMPNWPATARLIANRLWSRPEVIAGRTPEVVHVVLEERELITRPSAGERVREGVASR